MLNNIKIINNNFASIRSKQAELKETRLYGLKTAIIKIQQTLETELLNSPYKVALKATKTKILEPLVSSKTQVDKDTVRAINTALTLFFRGVQELANIEGLTPAMVEKAGLYFTVAECKALIECDGDIKPLYKEIAQKYKIEKTHKVWDKSQKKVSAK